MQTSRKLSIAVLILLSLSIKAFAQVPRGIVYRMMGGSNTVPKLPANVNLVMYLVNWAMVEPTNGTFDWSRVTNIENQLPRGAKLQLIIITGAYGAPTNSNVCNQWGMKDKACTAWLSDVTGVSVYSMTGPNGSDHGYNQCTRLYDPNPADPAYQRAFEGLISAIHTQFEDDSKISMISVAAMSSKGVDLSLTQSDDCGGSQHNQTEYYNSAWNNISGCHGDESCWTTYLEDAFNTLWSYEVDELANQNIALWSESSPFPNISQSSGSDVNIRNIMLTDAQHNQPRGSGAYLLLNENLQDNNSWWDAVNLWASHVDGLGAEVARSYTGQCSQFQSAIEQYGVPHGLDFAQVWGATFSSCASTIQTIISEEGW
jgi:hypothetical protein